MAISAEKLPAPGESPEIGDVVVDETLRGTEKEAVKTLTEEYGKGVELSKESQKVVSDYLLSDAQEGLQIFAKRWVEKPENLKKLADTGLLPDGASEEYKMNLVLRNPSYRIEMRTGEYAVIGKEMDKIEVLRADLAKENMPPETPFILLNYLQKSIGIEREKIDELKTKAEAGDESAGVAAASKQKQLETLFLAQKEIVEKTMHENLTESAEKKVTGGGFLSKEEYVKSDEFKTGVADLAKELETERNEELLNKEWEDFDRLSHSEKAKYMAETGLKMGTKDEFSESIKRLSKKSGIEGDDFYGLLAQGYRPYEAQKRTAFWPPSRIFTLKMSVTEIPCKNGKSFYTSGRNDKEFGEFVKRSGEKYKESLKLEAEGKLEDDRDKIHDNLVKEEVQKRIEQLAKSPEEAIGGVERFYKEAQERLVSESIKAIAEKNKTSAEQIKTVEKEIKEKGKNINIGNVIGDTYFCRGEFEDIWEDSNWEDHEKCFGKITRYCKKELGYSLDKKAFGKVTEARYKKIWETKTGLFGFLLEMMQNAVEAKKPKPKKKKKT